MNNKIVNRIYVQSYSGVIGSPVNIWKGYIHQMGRTDLITFKISPGVALPQSRRPRSQNFSDRRFSSRRTRKDGRGECQTQGNHNNLWSRPQINEVKDEESLQKRMARPNLECLRFSLHFEQLELYQIMSLLQFKFEEGRIL